jgi:predicted N-acetyltransferase YhbS
VAGTVRVRTERADEFDAIAQVVGAAFATEPIVVDLVERLRAFPATSRSDPRYYSRFGFRRASELGLERPREQIPEIAFQALPLAAYDPGLRGKVVYPPPFDSVT